MSRRAPAWYADSYTELPRLPEEDYERILRVCKEFEQNMRVPTAYQLAEQAEVSVEVVLEEQAHWGYPLREEEPFERERRERREFFLLEENRRKRERDELLTRMSKHDGSSLSLQEVVRLTRNALEQRLGRPPTYEELLAECPGVSRTSAHVYICKIRQTEECWITHAGTGKPSNGRR